jgi:hypothetical protein
MFVFHGSAFQPENKTKVTQPVGGPNYGDEITEPLAKTIDGVLSANFQIESHRPFVTLAGLKLHGVTFIYVFDLAPWREAAAMEEYILTAVIRFDKAKAFIPYNFLDRSGHNFLAPVNLADSASILDNPFPST